MSNNFSESSDLWHILELAKWAPSGDNGQPWRIVPLSGHEFYLDLVGLQQNVFNLLPMPNMVTMGMFLENATIAAQDLGYDLEWSVEEGTRIDVKIFKQTSPSQVEKKPLNNYIKKRSVNRYRYKLKKILDDVRTDLRSVLDDDMQIFWLEGFSDRWTIAKMLYLFTWIRLRLPDVHDIHREVIDWSKGDSPDKMPRGSLGANPVSVAMMEWVSANKGRHDFLLKMPGATLGFQMELDLIPALFCSGHFIMCFDAQKTPEPTTADYIRGGQAMQRFWLSLTSHHMVMQPWYLPLMFSKYIQKDIAFSNHSKIIDRTQKVHDSFVFDILAPLGLHLDHVFFTGRAGYPVKTNIKRSVRKDLKELIIQE